MSRAYKWLLLSLASVGMLFAVYFVGRRNRKGEVNLEVAKKELEAANAKHEQVIKQLDTLHDKRMDIVADIITEEVASAQKAGAPISDEDVLRRLRAHGLVH